MSETEVSAKHMSDPVSEETDRRERAVSEVEESELHKAAVHEASHLAVVQHFGGIARAEVWRAPEDRSGQMKAWRGRCHIYAQPGTVIFKGQVAAVPPPHWRQLVGLAGLVGELLSDGCADAWEVTFSIMMTIEVGEVSDTDLALLGSEWTEGHVAEVIAILTARADEVRMETASLVHDARLT
jgi:hypothetical protein